MRKMQLNFVDIKIKLWKSKGFFIITFLAVFMLGASVFSVRETEAIRNQDVLGADSKKVELASKPTISVSLTPATVPSITPKIIPSGVVVQKISPTPTTLPSNNSSSAVTLSPTSAPSITIAPTGTPTPTPAGLKVEIRVDYAGQKSTDSYSVIVNSDQTAWDAVVSSMGIDNIKYTDYGGDMGKFITSFNGIDAAGNQYYEFRVNGVSSNIGVSGYKCNDNDKLDFVLTSF